MPQMGRTNEIAAFQKSCLSAVFKPDPTQNRFFKT